MENLGSSVQGILHPLRKPESSGSHYGSAVDVVAMMCLEIPGWGSHPGPDVFPMRSLETPGWGSQPESDSFLMRSPGSRAWDLSCPPHKRSGD
jgi:hypothetical protein